MNDEQTISESPFVSDRNAFLLAISENPEDMAYRLIFADWLDEHGEHDEADRQRKYPDAKKWLDDLCEEFNKKDRTYIKISFEECLEFGRSVSQTQAVEYNCERTNIPTAIAEKIPDFWKAWAVVTGLPLTEDIEKKCYYDPGYYCCALENSPESHIAGPKTERFRRIDEELERQRLAFEAYEQQPFQEAIDQEAERIQQQFDEIQERLEEDRP